TPRRRNATGAAGPRPRGPAFGSFRGGRATGGRPQNRQGLPLGSFRRWRAGGRGAARAGGPARPAFGSFRAGAPSRGFEAVQSEHPRPSADLAIGFVSRHARESAARPWVVSRKRVGHPVGPSGAG